MSASRLYAKNLAECANGQLWKQLPVAGPEPVLPGVNPENERGTGPVTSFNPNSCMGVRARTSKEGNWRMAQKVGIVGIDISKRKADGCIRALDATLSKPSTPAGRSEMTGWLRENGVGMAVMEASGGYERDWAEALREAGLAVSIVDPKRVRYFAKSAGRLAKSDPIDAEMIAWYAEIFAGQTRRQAHQDRLGGSPSPLSQSHRQMGDRMFSEYTALVRRPAQSGPAGRMSGRFGPDTGPNLDYVADEPGRSERSVSARVRVVL